METKSIIAQSRQLSHMAQVSQLAKKHFRSYCTHLDIMLRVPCTPCMLHDMSSSISGCNNSLIGSLRVDTLWFSSCTTTHMVFDSMRLINMHSFGTDVLISCSTHLNSAIAHY